MDLDYEPARDFSGQSCRNDNSLLCYLAYDLLPSSCRYPSSMIIVVVWRLRSEETRNSKVVASSP